MKKIIVLFFGFIFLDLHGDMLEERALVGENQSQECKEIQKKSDEFVQAILDIKDPSELKKVATYLSIHIGSNAACLTTLFQCKKFCSKESAFLVTILVYIATKILLKRCANKYLLKNKKEEIILKDFAKFVKDTFESLDSLPKNGKLLLCKVFETEINLIKIKKTADEFICDLLEMTIAILTVYFIVSGVDIFDDRGIPFASDRHISFKYAFGVAIFVWLTEMLINYASTFDNESAESIKEIELSVDEMKQQLSKQTASQI